MSLSESVYERFKIVQKEYVKVSSKRRMQYKILCLEEKNAKTRK